MRQGIATANRNCTGLAGKGKQVGGGSGGSTAAQAMGEAKTAHTNLANGHAGKCGALGQLEAAEEGASLCLVHLPITATVTSGAKQEGTARVRLGAGLGEAVTGVAWRRT